MLVYLARHAWAGHYGDPGWPDDSQRPLTEEGVGRYRRMVERLVAGSFAPERIVTSPYVRCLQTAEILAEAVGVEPEPLEALEPGARLAPLVEWSNASGAGAVAWVGHNPDCERLVAELVGDRCSSVRFAKGAVACLRFDGPVARSEGTLIWHATAKLLGV
ncbi:phosphohistidine phosphatase [Planctomycetes bacterium MalM25]|nr:phosphohistidine phosphatase [Planctomycetes bacterium MalM25]